MQIYAERILVASLVALFFTTTLFAQTTAQLESTVQDQGKASKQDQAKSDEERHNNAASDAKKRDDALRAIMTRLEVGEGSTVADIGAGEGRDSWVFASVVGAEGIVYAEEIAKDKVETLKKQAAERNLPQLRPVLGGNDDPALPAASVDMEFMHYVYHHFSQPREMLAGLWRSLKPGGYLVIVDRRLGTLQDWVPREKRSEKHYWIAETTVVREARETGFAYIGCLDDYWSADDQFVLVFRRPHGASEPGVDPDPPLSLDLEHARQRIFSIQSTFERPVFVALGQARELIGPILDRSTGPGVDVILEEWATQKDERPELPDDVSLPAVLTERGYPPLDEEPIDAVFFLDTYHVLFHASTLLGALRERLTPAGRVFVLDRVADTGLSRREASHQRKIQVAMVKQEMVSAGFRFVSKEPAPAEDRMLLVFQTEASTETQREADRWNGKVYQYGEMREVLGQGRHEGRIQLGSVTNRPHCHAVGALEQLSGEITILDGRVTVTGVDERGQPTARSSDAQPEVQRAAMLVASYVPRWTEYQIAHDVTAESFEAMLSEMASQAGLDESAPFPFVIEGTLLSLELHVINGACPMRAERLGQKLPLDRQPYRGSLEEVDGRVVGIYAEGAEHRLTHHGTKTHTHVLLKDRDGQLYTGHVERVGLRAGAVLRLPAR